jgi:hypothetical protein
MFKWWENLLERIYPKPIIIVPKTKGEERDFLCSINFELNFDNTVNIVCYWPDLDKLDETIVTNIANQYGALMFILDTGSLREDIISSLTAIADKNNVSDSFFVEKVLAAWIEIKKKGLLDNSYDPVIKPSSVFKNYTR